MDKLSGVISQKSPNFTEITWKISRFLEEPVLVDPYLTSPPFHFSDGDWRLELFPNGRRRAQSTGSIDLFLNRLRSQVARQRVVAIFSFGTQRGEKHGNWSFESTVDEDCSKVGGQTYLETSKIRQEMKFLVPDNTLTVRCQILVEVSMNYELLCASLSEQIRSISRTVEKENASSQTEACPREEAAPAISASVLKLQSDYKKLLETKQEADVCIKVSDKEFRAHKCILGARSSVFSAMFKHDTEEKASGEVVIEDLDPKSFPDFLQHVYAGSVDTLSDENVFSLYTAADKYDMADLKSECKSFMERTLSVDTFCDVMILALRYKEDELLKVAIDFFCKNLTRIIVTVKWQKFLKEYDTAANELLIKALVPAHEK